MRAQKQYYMAWIEAFSETSMAEILEFRRKEAAKSRDREELANVKKVYRLELFKFMRGM